MGPISLAVVVVLVLFIVLALWVEGGRDRDLASPADHEVVHSLAGRWSARWPQSAGRATDYYSQADQEAAEGHPAEAAQLLAKALALEPNAPSGLLRLVVLVAEAPDPDLLSAEEAEAVVQVVSATHPDHPSLPVARAALLLAEGDPAACLDRLADGPDTLDGHWLAARAHHEQGSDPLPDALAVLAVAPAHAPSCTMAVQAGVSRGLFAQAERTSDACLAAGARSDALLRATADIQDGLGNFALARDRYEQAGAIVHAAAITYQEGLPDEDGLVERALSSGDPMAALHDTWRALLMGDEDGAVDAARLIADRGEAGHHFSYALAAVALASGHPDRVPAFVQDIDTAPAWVLRARAHANLDQGREADKSFGRAAELEPWNPNVWRERLAWADATGNLDEALASLSGVDLVAVHLAEQWRLRDSPWSAIAPSAAPCDKLSSLGALLGCNDAAEPQVIALLESGDQAGIEAMLASDELAQGSIGRRFAQARLDVISGKDLDAELALTELLDEEPNLIGARRELYFLRNAALGSDSGSLDRSPALQ